MTITKYVKDATVLMLGHSAQGFNKTLADVSVTYALEPLAINWNPGGPQFFQANLTPDDLDESTPSKYPMVFMYGVRSQNTHQSMGRTFSGQVELALIFWLTHKASSAGKAGSALEALCDAIEDTCNSLFTNGNWPALYGAASSVCLPPSCARSSLEAEGEGWRQSLVFRLVFTLDKN